VSGALIRDLFAEGYVDQPDWAPDGAAVAMVHVRGTVFSDLNFYEGEIALYPWDGQDLGTPTVVVPWEAGINSYAPAFSPDGRWIAFSRSTGDANSDPDAEVWLVSRDGGPPLRLDAANGEGPQGNSMPRWAPLPDDDVLWLAFSSRRSYPPKDRGETTRDQRPQIWIASLDPARAEQGEDPSRAAFWLPGQDLESDNHLPVWWRE
jgi:Tol biopolymer transport system component